MDERIFKSKFLGTLMGTSTGDSLGVLFEGIREFAPEEIEPIAERQEVIGNTDDTQMMIGVSESHWMVAIFHL